jgi:hypothetical protein
MAASARSPSGISVTALCLLLVVVALALPRVSAEYDIPLCSTTSGGHLDINLGTGSYNLYSWSIVGEACYANSVTGLSSLSSFAYTVGIFSIQYGRSELRPSSSTPRPTTPSWLRSTSPPFSPRRIATYP